MHAQSHAAMHAQTHTAMYTLVSVTSTVRMKATAGSGLLVVSVMSVSVVVAVVVSTPVAEAVQHCWPRRSAPSPVHPRLFGRMLWSFWSWSGFYEGAQGFVYFLNDKTKERYLKKKYEKALKHFENLKTPRTKHRNGYDKLRQWFHKT